MGFFSKLFKKKDSSRIKRLKKIFKELSQSTGYDAKTRQSHADELKRLKNKPLVDEYFNLGLKANELFKKHKYDKAKKLALKQIEWYRDENNRKMLRFDLMGVLPKSILGLDVLISILNKEKKIQEILSLINEFKNLVDPDSEYCHEDMIKVYQAKKLRFDGEKALEEGVKDKAILLFEKALELYPNVGVKRKLKNLKK